MATPHINAEAGQIAPAVLMPGDPKRAERMANQLFDDPKLVNDVRGMLAYTGTYQGHPLTIMGSGMGQPSIGIYSNELFQFFGVERIIRVGTCGGLSAKVHVGDTVIATSAHTDSNFNQDRIPGIFFSAASSFKLVSAAVEASKDAQIPENKLHVGTIVSRDHFYGTSTEQNQALASYGVLGVEMESAALFAIAAEHGKEALTVLTVSDHLFSGEGDMTAQEREELFQNSLKLALAAALV